MTIITSRTNKLIIETAKLKDKKYRNETGLFAFEGIKLMQEAILKKAEIECVFVTPKMINLVQKYISDEKIISVTEEVYEKLTEERAPQGIITVCKSIDKLHFYNKIYSICDQKGFSKEDKVVNRVFCAESIRDPGNLGTLIRTANAFGVDWLILSSDSADLYNRKTIRASMGALFSQKIYITDDLPQTIQELGECGYCVYAAALGARETVDCLKMDRHTCFVVGNEGNGLTQEVIDACGNRKVLIPMEANAESLNASIASGVLLWELYRKTK